MKHVVVHRQSEEDHEQEQRQPCGYRPSGFEAQQRLTPTVLEDKHQDAVARANREQIQDDRLDRDDDRAERRQEQQERHGQDEREDQRGV